MRKAYRNLIFTGLTFFLLWHISISYFKARKSFHYILCGGVFLGGLMRKIFWIYCKALTTSPSLYCSHWSLWLVMALGRGRATGSIASHGSENYGIAGEHMHTANLLTSIHKNGLFFFKFLPVAWEFWMPRYWMTATGNTQHKKSSYAHNQTFYST